MERFRFFSIQNKQQMLEAYKKGAESEYKQRKLDESIETDKRGEEDFRKN